MGILQETKWRHRIQAGALMDAREQFNEFVVDRITPWMVARGYVASKMRIFSREDSLLGTVRVDPGKYVNRTAYGFTLMLNLGIPQLTWMTLTRWDWALNLVVHGEFPWKQAQRFEFVTENDPGPVGDAALSALDSAFEEYFDVPTSVCDPMNMLTEENDRLSYLQVFPPNAFGRAELATGYARFLGWSEKERTLRAELTVLAKELHVEHLLADVMAKIDAVVPAAG